MTNKPPQLPLDYATPEPRAAWVILPFLGGVVLGFISVFGCVFAAIVGSSQSIWAPLLILGVLIIAGIAMAFRSDGKRRRLTPFVLGFIAGACLGILGEGVCFVAITHSNF